MVSEPASPALVLDRREVGDGPVPALVLRCRGDIDSLNAAELAVAVRDGLDSVAVTPPDGPSTPGRLLVVDLREVTFLGASAVTALLVGAGETLGEQGRMRLVVGVDGPVRRVVDVLDLHATFAVHHDLTRALRA